MENHIIPVLSWKDSVTTIWDSLVPTGEGQKVRLGPISADPNAGIRSTKNAKPDAIRDCLMLGALDRCRRYEITRKLSISQKKDPFEGLLFFRFSCFY